MAMKARKKSSKKTTKKTTKKTAQVEMDPGTVLRFEAELRQGLVASGAVLMSTATPELQAGATVRLGSDAAQQISQILRDGLVSSAAVLATEFPETMPAARKATKKKTKSARKTRGRVSSKKR
jgi:hypothetical protein